MRVIVFGVGAYYRDRREKLCKHVEIIAYVDNNSSLWGNKIDHVIITRPEKVLDLDYDAIILMSVHAYEMRMQLLDIGVQDNKIMNYSQLLSHIDKEIMICYYSGQNQENAEKVAIATLQLTYHGGILAAYYLAQVLKKKNYNVFIIVPPNIDENLLQEMNANGCNVIICGQLISAGYDEMPWLDDFKYIIINTFQMIHLASAISMRRQIVWWLHEPEYVYKELQDERYLAEKNMDGSFGKNMKIFAVSNIARSTFEKYYSEQEVDLLLPCIPDVEIEPKRVKKNCLIFAVIGGISENKSQLHFLKAAERLENRAEIEFWLIGDIPETTYVDEVKALATKMPEVKLLGVKSRIEMEELLQQIDVVVCASKEETLSLTIVEGMMHKKICITSDTAGIADFIRDGENGFIYESQNNGHLAEKMQWVISNEDKLNDMRQAARKTYEDFFSPEVMEKRIECIF